MTHEINEDPHRQSGAVDYKITEPDNGAVAIQQEPTDLPAADGGWLAWRFALVAFVIDGIVWGPTLCFGIFLPFKPYSELNPSLAALIGTSCLGLLYCTGVVLSPLALRYPTFCIWSPWIGSILCFIGLFSASYTDKAVFLILTQGVLYGIGGSMIYTPNLIYLSEWWVLKRGLIGGLTFSGSAVLGLAWGPMMQWILEKHSTPVTLRYYSVLWLLLVLMLLPFFHGRLPRSSRTKPESTNMEYMKLPLFWFLILVNCVQSLAFYVPVIYMPSFATSMGSSGALPLEFYSAASIPSQIIGGMASDFMDCSWILFISCMTSSISVFLMWGFCKDFAMFCGFCTIYGLFAPCYTSLWHRFSMIIAPKDPRSASIINFFLASRGVANIMTGPLSGLLLNTPTPSMKDYRGVINSCGTLLLISSLGVGMRLFYGSVPESPSKEETYETHTTSTDHWHHVTSKDLRNRKEDSYEMNNL
ncbi:hypothetical protein PGT21_027720 [Puccinia graminis f. sp. tritici]|uniref:Major facilitator superfamily (MFS) profile domain-containing protein n=2 Tax=Puccinia graminis f. sp. tritici TaxID=56615 RepID=E3KPK9_PUCGT|nr:uncharacterized protein PGTG_12200 [Puccinia graminis f. sp. tritici CRL 75-36-700-3]EFP86244.2 hypothetical protein PGTG_12200 [Puccinia graminis f. sp. tritici CRL 75-36-700-3]KAA1074990.1 hypothetical protein PGT21_026491 [Puccinia graminis f. sp. tritici]KAA1081017.1 hypothetical protein PGT21_027720 [Puccinia graminis f. sp. tritici]KAA1131173.1 hypothetical protein PGTUg99_020976 [Puccinia graminis f. sp. tritici]